MRIGRSPAVTLESERSESSFNEMSPDLILIVNVIKERSRYFTNMCQGTFFSLSVTFGEP